LTAAESESQNAAVSLRPATVANIVLPLDGSTPSRAAAPIACALAKIYDATTHVLYVGERKHEPKQVLALLGLTLEDIPGAVLDPYQGDAAEVIARAAHELPQALIVMCTHTGPRVKFDCFGSVAEAVMEKNPERIVLLTPDRGDKPFVVRRILLAHDATPTSDVVIAPAAEIARRAGAEVIALHVAARQAASPEQPGSFPAPRYIDQPHHEWPTWAREFVDRMLTLHAPMESVHFNLVVAGGQPGSEVAQVARQKDVDLVIMACDRPWDCSGHTATRVVISTSGCPVLLCSPAAEP